MNYYQPKINAETGVATQNNIEPSAYSYTEMGTSMSDDYSYLDQTSDEMAAKGEGGTRQMHSFVLLNDNQTIETPPEDYIPDKVRETDLEKLQKQRTQHFKEAIYSEDFSFFESKDYTNDLKNTRWDADDIHSFIDEMKHSSKTMSIDNKKKTMKYLSNLTKMSELYHKQ